VGFKGFLGTFADPVGFIVAVQEDEDILETKEKSSSMVGRVSNQDLSPW